jgi:hypothetical protein
VTLNSSTDLAQRIADAVESAPPLLRARSEWKVLERWHREFEEAVPTGSLSEDEVREAEAKLDLFDLARSEVELAQQVDDEAREARLRADKELLAALGSEGKVYIGLIALSFVLPPLLLLTPLGLLLILGVVPALLGFLRMRGVEQPANGRVWLVLQDHVDEVLERVRLLHGAAIAALLLTGVWTVLEMFSAGTQG